MGSFNFRCSVYNGSYSDYLTMSEATESRRSSDEESPILRDKLAEVQHAIWAHWMNHLFGVSTRNDDGSYTISAEKAEQWIRQMNTPYTELPDNQKESDREQADKVLATSEGKTSLK